MVAGAFAQGHRVKDARAEELAVQLRVLVANLERVVDVPARRRDLVAALEARRARLGRRRLDGQPGLAPLLGALLGTDCRRQQLDRLGPVLLPERDHEPAHVLSMAAWDVASRLSRLSRSVTFERLSQPRQKLPSWHGGARRRGGPRLVGACVIRYPSEERRRRVALHVEGGAGRAPSTRRRWRRFPLSLASFTVSGQFLSARRCPCRLPVEDAKKNACASGERSARGEVSDRASGAAPPSPRTHVCSSSRQRWKARRS